MVVRFESGGLVNDQWSFKATIFKAPQQCVGFPCARGTRQPKTLEILAEITLTHQPIYMMPDSLNFEIWII